MSDEYSSLRPESFGPARRAWAVTPSDSARLPFVTTGLYVGGDGDVAVAPFKSTATVVFKGVRAGSILPIRVTRVLATGSTATNIVGLG